MLLGKLWDEFSHGSSCALRCVIAPRVFIKGHLLFWLWLYWQTFVLVFTRGYTLHLNNKSTFHFPTVSLQRTRLLLRLITVLVNLERVPCILSRLVIRGIQTNELWYSFTVSFSCNFFRNNSTERKYLRLLCSVS